MSEQTSGGELRCKSCGAPIRWGRTGSGRNIPLDAAPTPDGNVTMFDRIAVIHTKDSPPPEPGELRYTAHFKTCPHAGSWRRRT